MQGGGGRGGRERERGGKEKDEEEEGGNRRGRGRSLLRLMGGRSFCVTFTYKPEGCW